jgi:hypothetical protein
VNRRTVAALSLGPITGVVKERREDLIPEKPDAAAKEQDQEKYRSQTATRARVVGHHKRAATSPYHAKVPVQAGLNQPANQLIMTRANKSSPRRDEGACR